MLIVPIVEGHGEVEAVPILIRRISDALQISRPDIASPIRISRNKIVRNGKVEKAELERVFQLAYLKLREPGAILLLLDGNSDCPAKLGPQLLSTMQSIRPDIAVSAVLAKKEYEAWFLAALASLRGKRGISSSAVLSSDPEAMTGAKERLESFMQDRSYSETLDQPALTDQFDLDQALKNSPSFDKFWRELKIILSGDSGQGIKSSRRD